MIVARSVLVNENGEVVALLRDQIKVIMKNQQMTLVGKLIEIDGYNEVIQVNLDTKLGNEIELCFSEIEEISLF